ncbi:hypothetical protein Cgig2_018104 [Carnegiea gigantea]|uniref:Alkyl transferase n=1 Tax=Carnegiea gigantea TaxID=171969 RepID=A0A9Q1JZ74_9CARY|nr:hypothetical protein Cgig2_018104 [Carnegiea gigantea]
MAGHNSLHEQGRLRVSMIGDLSKLPTSIQKWVAQVEEKTKDNKKFYLIVAVSYSGKYDITKACRSIAQKVKDGLIQVEDVNEELIERELETKCTQFPYPDLLIRTSGELRISNFLLWQLAYTELFFSRALWPDVGEEDFAEALRSFQQRNRRFGGRDLHGSNCSNMKLLRICCNQRVLVEYTEIASSTSSTNKINPRAPFHFLGILNPPQLPGIYLLRSKLHEGGPRADGVVTSPARARYFNQIKASTEDYALLAHISGWKMLMKYSLRTPPIESYGIFDTAKSGMTTPLLPNDHGSYCLILTGINVDGSDLDFPSGIFEKAIDEDVNAMGFLIDSEPSTTPSAGRRNLLHGGGDRGGAAGGTEAGADAATCGGDHGRKWQVGSGARPTSECGPLGGDREAIAHG